jgi:hypothetical protein
MFFYGLMIFSRLLAFGCGSEHAVEINVLLSGRKELHRGACRKCGWLFGIHWSLFIFIILRLKVFVLGIAT